MCFCSAGSRSRIALTGILEPQGAGPTRLTWGMPTGPEAFLELSGMSVLRPCTLTHLKSPCAILVRLVGRTTNTDFLPAEWSVYTTLWEALCWDTLRSAALVSTQIWSGVSWFQWQSVEVRLDRDPRVSGGRPPKF